MIENEKKFKEEMEKEGFLVLKRSFPSIEKILRRGRQMRIGLIYCTQNT